MAAMEDGFETPLKDERTKKIDILHARCTEVEMRPCSTSTVSEPVTLPRPSNFFFNPLFGVPCLCHVQVQKGTNSHKSKQNGESVTCFSPWELHVGDIGLEPMTSGM